MNPPLTGAQSASYAAAFPALSEVYSLTSIIEPEHEVGGRLGGSSTRSSSGTRGVPRTGSNTPSSREGLSGCVVTGLGDYSSTQSPVLLLGPGVSGYLRPEKHADDPAGAPSGSFPFPGASLERSCGPQQGDHGSECLKAFADSQPAPRSRSTPSLKPAVQMQNQCPPLPVGKIDKPLVKPSKNLQEQRITPPTIRASYTQPPTPPPSSCDSFPRGPSDGLQQQHRPVGRQQRQQQQHTYPPAASLRKAGAGAHYLQHLDALRGGPVGAGGPRKNGGACLGRGVLSSPSDGPQRLAHPLSGLCLQPLGDGCFRSVPRTNQREGHRQRVAGVDVWRLPDGCIVPRIEGAPLSVYLSERVEALSELEKALLSCVQFLYKEGIKPFAGEIAHQLRKRTNAGTWLPSEVVALAMVSHHVYPKVERRVKGEDGWVILLKKHLEPEGFEGFVDTRAKENLYTQEQWLHFNKYFIDKLRQGNLSPSSFTEGRYALAERMREEVPAFSKTRLAHLIRMIQLASWNRVLTYRDKALIPVAACPAAAKEFIQRHCVDPNGEKAAATAAAIAHLLKVMRRIVNPEPLGIFLAQLKDLVRWTTHERLDAGVYGHPKLQDLLLSDPFSRFYRLYTPEGNDHCTYVQSKQYLLPKGAVIHRKAAVMWRPRDCPMGGSDTPLADSRVWEFKALVPIGGAADKDAPLFEPWEQQQQQQQKQQPSMLLQQQPLVHSWSTPAWDAWNRNPGECDISTTRCFYDQQQQQRNRNGNSGFPCESAGWKDTEDHEVLTRSKTETNHLREHYFSPPYTSNFPKIARKSAPISTDKTQNQTAETLMTLQTKQPHEEGMYGCDTDKGTCIRQQAQQHQQQQQQQQVLPPLQRTQQIGATGFIEGNGESTLSGIERSLLQLVEESPCNTCGVSTAEDNSKEQRLSQKKPPCGGLASAGDAEGGVQVTHAGNAVQKALGLRFPFKLNEAEVEDQKNSEWAASGDAPTAPDTPRLGAEQPSEVNGQWGKAAPLINGTNAHMASLDQSAYSTSPRETVQLQPPCPYAGPFGTTKCAFDATPTGSSNHIQQHKEPQQYSKQLLRHHEEQQQQAHEQPEDQPQSSGLQFLWNHPAAFLASRVQNTAATDLGFLPHFCDAAAQET